MENRNKVEAEPEKQIRIAINSLEQSHLSVSPFLIPKGRDAIRCLAEKSTR
jgi:hypothetical protein